MTIRIERAEADIDTAVRLYKFIRPMAIEVALAPVDDERAFTGFCSVLDEGRTFVALDGDEVVGILALAEASYWYAAEGDTYLIDRPFFVSPDRRFGDVGIRLLRAARDEGKRVGKSVFVLVANPDRRPKNNEASAYTIVAGYTPVFHMMKLHQEPVAGTA